jgi:hypothetical protein
VKCGYQNKPPIIAPVEDSESADDIDDDDEDLNDEMAIKIQMLTSNSFANMKQLYSVSTVRGEEGEGGGGEATLPAPPPSSSEGAESHIRAPEATSEYNAALKSNLYSHIDKVMFCDLTPVAVHNIHSPLCLVTHVLSSIPSNLCMLCLPFISYYILMLIYCYK